MGKITKSKGKKMKKITAARWGQSLNPPIGTRRVVTLCNGKKGGKSKVKGAELIGRMWFIPENAPDPRNTAWPLGKRKAK